MPTSISLDPQQFGARLGILRQTGELDHAGLAALARTAVRRWGVCSRQSVQLHLSTQLKAAGHSDSSEAARECLDGLVLIGDLGQLDVGGRTHLAPGLPHVVRAGSHAIFVGAPEHGAASARPGAAGVQRYVRWLDDAEAAEQLLSEGAIDWDLDDLCTLGSSVPASEPARAELWGQLAQAAASSDLVLEDLSTVRVVGPWSRFFGGLRGDRIAAESGRWSQLSPLGEGTFLGARRGYSDVHWHPCVVSCAGGRAGVSDLRGWEHLAEALVARGEVEGTRECVIEHPDGRLEQTCPLPVPAVRALALLASPGERPWTWHPRPETRAVLGRVLGRLGLVLRPDEA